MQTKIQKAAVKLEVAEAEVKGLFFAVDEAAKQGHFIACELLHQKLSKKQAERDAAFQAWISLY